jgi:hypothetical protein
VFDATDCRFDVRRAIQSAAKHVRVVRDSRERIPDFVGNSSRDATDAGESLRVATFAFRSLEAFDNGVGISGVASRPYDNARAGDERHDADDGGNAKRN